jgi:UDP-N-acetylglucosamine--N-acetylmuramyl-(pentapeptide) pyrophosphoryl-undecaprenol N-acetylglucosamine transferase
MPLRIAYFIHGRGRGHASRSVPVARRLVGAGHEVSVHGGGNAQDLADETLDWRPRTPLLPGAGGVIRLPTQVARDIVELGRLRPDLVVSDGDQAILAAARARRIPALALGHDLVFTCCALPDSLPRAALRYEWANAATPTHLTRQRVAVHFLPATPSRAGTSVARPDGDRAPAATSGEHLVAYFRDANGAAVVEWIRALGWEVRWFGPGATTPDGNPSPFAGREEFQHELRTAAGVIGSAGSNLIAECVLHGKPLLALHRRDDTEQTLNALLARAANVAEASPIEQATRELATRFVDRVRAGDFAPVDLASQLRPVSDVMVELVEAHVSR